MISAFLLPILLVFCKCSVISGTQLSGVGVYGLWSITWIDIQASQLYDLGYILPESQFPYL